MKKLGRQELEVQGNGMEENWEENRKRQNVGRLEGRKKIGKTRWWEGRKLDRK